MTQRCGSSQPTPTPLPRESTKPQEKCCSKKTQTKNGRREKRYRTLQRMAGSTGARAITSPQISEGNGTREKEKTGPKQQNRNKNEMRKRWGRRRKSLKPREQYLKRSQERTRTLYVRNSIRARGMDIVPHPAAATSKV